jgi:hypothetical protein
MYTTLNCSPLDAAYLHAVLVKWGTNLHGNLVQVEGYTEAKTQMAIFSVQNCVVCLWVSGVSMEPDASTLTVDILKM